MNRFSYLKGDKIERLYREFPIENQSIVVKNVADLEDAARFIRREFECKEIYPADEMSLNRLQYGWLFDGGKQVVHLLIKIKDLHADMEEEERIRYFGSERGRMAYAAYLLSC